MKLKTFLWMSTLTFFLSLEFPSYAMQGNSFENTLEERLRPQMRLSPENLYNFAVKLRKGEVVEYSQKETLEASFLCFKEVFIKNRKEKDKTLFGKAAHNLGNIFNLWKQPQVAAKMYLIAAATGLKESERNLQKLQQQEALPQPKKPDFEMLQELENMQRNLANNAVNFVHMMDQFEQGLMQNMPQIVESMISQFSSKLGLDYAPDFEQTRALIQRASYSNPFAQRKDELTRDFLSNIANEGLLPLQKMKEKAKQTGIDRSDIDEISYKRLLSHIFTPTEIQQSLFSQETLRENDRVSKKLIEVFAPRTLPVIIGRSCEWIMEHFKRHYPEQFFIKIAGSGLYNLDRLDNNFSPIISEEAREAYKEYLKSFNLSSILFDKNQYDSITLVDRTESGDSILALSVLLHEVDNRFDLDGIKLKRLGIVSEENAVKFTFPTIVVNATALRETIKKHDDDQAKALSRSFDYPHWKQWRTFDFYPLPLEPAQARLKQVELFIHPN